MGRLENIIARNRSGGRPRERIITSLVFGGIILLILGLMVLTDLGAPPAPAPSPSTTVEKPRGPHADGVLLYAPGARRGSASAKSAAPSATRAGSAAH